MHNNDESNDLNLDPKHQKREIMLASDEDEGVWKSISDRVLNAHEVNGEQLSEQLPKSLRPESFDDYIGQERIKENMLVACRAARKRMEPLDHTLFHGPPGLGKTSLARIIAKTLGVGFKSTSGPVIERAGDLAAILTSLAAHDVLFIDEIHRLPRVVEEVLYPALEDFQIDIIIGQGPAAKSIAVELKPFTLVAATTRTSLLTSPLRDRFGIMHRLEYYNSDQLAAVVSRSAKILGLDIDLLAAKEIGSRARGTPRIANRLLRRVRDLADQNNKKQIDLALTKQALNMLEIDHFGLDGMDRNLLTLIIEKFSGGPVGIETIAAALGEERATIEDVYEPYLIQEGFLLRTRRGREASSRAYEHLGFNLPKTEINTQQKLLLGNKL